MSIGKGCYAQKINEDDNIVVYAYGAFNWNSPETANNEKILDGEISIDKAAFLGGEKIIPLITEGRISIKNSRFCSVTTPDEGLGCEAVGWLRKLSGYMKEHEEFPDRLSVVK